MNKKLLKLMADPLGTIRQRITTTRDALKYRKPEGYDAANYWQDRLGRHGMNLRGVGNYGLSEEENVKDYQKAKETFLEVCRQENIVFKGVRILEIGCGAGFYTRIIAENEGTDYLGADIADVLFPALSQEFPQFRFCKLDITTDPLDASFDIIVMIDVTQHIALEERFQAAMTTLRAHLNPGGVFIVTSWLKEDLRNSYYEVSRPLSAYERAFPGCRFSSPVPFRDKFLFTISKPPC